MSDTTDRVSDSEIPGIGSNPNSSLGSDLIQSAARIGEAYPYLV